MSHPRSCDKNVANAGRLAATFPGGRQRFVLPYSLLLNLELVGDVHVFPADVCRADARDPGASSRRGDEPRRWAAHEAR